MLSWNPPEPDYLRGLHLDPEGRAAPGWPDSGIVLAHTPWTAWDISNCTDGAGGAYFTWSQTEPDDVFALHLRNDGTLAGGWPIGGLDVTPYENHQERSIAVADGMGGLLLAWQDWRYYSIGTQDTPFAQRLDASGAVHAGWSSFGTRLSSDSDAWPFTLVADGSGGALVGWLGYFDGIAVQRIDGEGRYGPMLASSSEPAVRFLPPSPNPFRSSVSCEFLLAHEAPHGAVDVVDLAGRKIAVLMGRQDLPAGSHRVRWNGVDRQGRIAPPGLYFLVVHGAHEERSTRLIKVR